MNMPDYGTHPIKCGSPRCTWQGYETDRPKVPHPKWPNAQISACPACGKHEYEFLTVRALRRFESETKSPFGLNELDITFLRTMADGRGFKAAARKLERSVDTLRDRAQAVYRKMGCNSIERAVLLAERAGLLKDVP